MITTKMLTIRQGFWLSGNPQEILQQIDELRKKHFYVRDVLTEYLN